MKKGDTIICKIFVEGTGYVEERCTIIGKVGFYFKVSRDEDGLKPRTEKILDSHCRPYVAPRGAIRGG